MNVARSKYDTLSVNGEHDTYHTTCKVTVPDEYYILQDMENFTVKCIPYFSTIEDITCEDYKCTMNWLKGMGHEPERLTKFVYKPC